MASSNQIAAVAAAMGDPARVNMLLSLRYDGVLTATELAHVANIAPSTASEHLAKLGAAHLVSQQKQGRKRLYTLADGDVCDLVDGVAALAEKNRQKPSCAATLPTGVLHSRLCLDHLAGALGCRITNALFDRDLLRHGISGPEITSKGRVWFTEIGVEAEAQDQSPRCPLRLCHDWSDDAYHLGGGVAAMLLATLRRHDWVRTRRGEVEVVLTPKGVRALKDRLGFDARQMERLR